MALNVCYLTAVLAYRKRRLEPVAQRVKRLCRRLLGGSAKQQRVHGVTVGGLSAKRVEFPHVSVAAGIQRHLERLRGTGIAPAPLARYGGELWVEFLEGAPLARDAAPPLDALADLFAALYALPLLADVPTREALSAEVASDLDALLAAGVLEARGHAALRERAASLAPAAPRFGLDYLDARPANFLRIRDGALCIIDVESLADDLVGTGAARAWLRWPGVGRDELLARLVARGAAEVAEQADFLELRFAARWTLRCVLQRKLGLVDPALLAGLAGPQTRS